MSVDRDHVVLSERERRALAGLESQAAASDPALEARMVAGRPRRWLAWRPGLRVAGPLFAVGVIVVLATLPLSPWVAFVGVLMMGVAMRWTLASLASQRVRAWWDGRPGPHRGGRRPSR
jgi:hypothetical protein